MSEEFNEFVALRIKLHSERTGMKTGDAHPWVRHSSRAAAFEAWDHQQKIIEQQQKQIVEIESTLERLKNVHETACAWWKRDNEEMDAVKKELQARIDALESAVYDSLHGEPLDDSGNRDENGLLRGYSSAYAAYRLAKVCKDEKHD